MEKLVDELREGEDAERLLEDDQLDEAGSSEVEARVLRQLTAAASKLRMAKPRSAARSRAKLRETWRWSYQSHSTWRMLCVWILPHVCVLAASKWCL